MQRHTHLDTASTTAETLMVAVSVTAPDVDVWSAGVVALLTLAAAAYVVVASRNSVPPLRVSGYSAKQLKGTDGSRLCFDQDQPQLIGQVAISGGEIARSR